MRPLLPCDEQRVAIATVNDGERLRHWHGAVTEDRVEADGAMHGLYH